MAAGQFLIRSSQWVSQALHQALPDSPAHSAEGTIKGAPGRQVAQLVQHWITGRFGNKWFVYFWPALLSTAQQSSTDSVVEFKWDERYVFQCSFSLSFFWEVYSMASFFYFFQHFLLCNNSRHELCSGFGPFYTQKNNYGRRPLLVSAAVCRKVVCW